MSQESALATKDAPEDGSAALTHVRRDLGADELWERSLARSYERRRRRQTGDATPRSLASVALADLDGPAAYRVRALRPGRDLSDEELWDLSLACSRVRRQELERPVLAQTRAAGASLVVAAVAAALPAPTGAHRSGGKSPSTVEVTLLRLGSRGPSVAALQRALGIRADGIFGPRTLAAVRAFQARHGLAVDGVVGPKTRAALRVDPSGADFRTFRAPWVAPVQRALGIPADGIFGPQTRAAVIAFQARKGLVVDGIVGPQTLAALGLAGKPSSGARSSPSPAPSSSHAAAVVAAARAQLGKPYGWGGNGPGAFDCSGLTVWSFRQAGISLPRTSYAQHGAGRPVSRSDVRAGDLVFFSTNGPGPSHVGIALGRWTFVSATTHGVRVQPIGGSYWGRAYVGARRIV